MQYPFPRPRTANGLAAGSLVAAVNTLGEAAFPAGFLRVLHDVAAVDLFAAYSFNASGQPRLCMAMGGDPAAIRFAQQASQRYAATYWRHDPAAQHLLPHRDRLQSPVLRQQFWAEIPASEYRSVCYETPGVVDRVSMLGRAGHRQILLNTYRRASRGPFSVAELERLADSADVMTALVGKHLALSQTQQQPDVEAIQERLADSFPSLSPRERQVCAAILTGLSVKEIARLHELELSSVITYKRRAYGKLGVTGRRGLCAAYAQSDTD